MERNIILNCYIYITCGFNSEIFLLFLILFYIWDILIPMPKKKVLGSESEKKYIWKVEGFR